MSRCCSARTENLKAKTTIFFISDFTAFQRHSENCFQGAVLLIIRESWIQSETRKAKTRGDERGPGDPTKGWIATPCFSLTKEDKTPSTTKQMCSFKHFLAVFLLKQRQPSNVAGFHFYILTVWTDVPSSARASFAWTSGDRCTLESSPDIHNNVQLWPFFMAWR